MENCYYFEFGVCTNKFCRAYNKSCDQPGECAGYITESAYFDGLMKGSIKENQPTEEEKRENRRRAKEILGPEKTKKQLKREAKIEAEKNKVEGGFALGDDPMFKDLFGKIK